MSTLRASGPPTCDRAAERRRACRRPGRRSRRRCRPRPRRPRAGCPSPAATLTSVAVAARVVDALRAPASRRRRCRATHACGTPPSLRGRRSRRAVAGEVDVADRRPRRRSGRRSARPGTSPRARRAGNSSSERSAGRTDGVARRLQVEGLRRAPTGERRRKLRLRAGCPPRGPPPERRRPRARARARPTPARPPITRRHALHAASGSSSGARRRQPEPGAAQQHVADRARLLAPGGVGDLGQQVGPARRRSARSRSPGGASTSWATCP